MKYMINDTVVLSRPPEGPLAGHIGSFTEWVSEQGYAASSLRQRVKNEPSGLIAKACKWMFAVCSLVGCLIASLAREWHAKQ